MHAPRPARYSAEGKYLKVDGLLTYYFECGTGAPLILLHGGEFGCCGELSWEYNVAALSEHYRVIVPDWLGYGNSAKVHDFGNFSLRMLQHMSRFCECLGIDNAAFAGNSMGAQFLLRDAASASPQLPMTSIVAICGGGAVPDNSARRALINYDCTEKAMQQVVDALFYNEAWSLDPAYVSRRHRLSLVPGAWECAAAARFHSPHRAPGVEVLGRSSSNFTCIKMPTLLVAGMQDKLKPVGYAQDLHIEIPGSEVLEVESAGHCPQIEQCDLVNDAIIEFLRDKMA
jgi:pimeloyl-ACP methyl ester carboxylesterase